MSKAKKGTSRNTFLIPILASVVAIFFLSFLGGSKIVNTIIGEVFLLLIVFIALWLAKMVASRRRTAGVSQPSVSAGLPVIRLGGAADQQFEHRLASLRRTARYLLLADFLALGLVANLTAGDTANLAVMVTIAGFGILALLSVISVQAQKFSGEITIKAAPERVFAILADPQRWRGSDGWLGRYTSVEAVPLGSGGFKGSASVVAFGIRGHMQWEMLDYRPPEHVATFARQKWLGIPSITLADWSIERKNGTTLVRYQQEYRNLGFSFNPARSLMRGPVQRTIDGRLTQIKAQAETAE